MAPTSWCIIATFSGAMNSWDKCLTSFNRRGPSQQRIPQGAGCNIQSGFEKYIAGADQPAVHSASSGLIPCSSMLKTSDCIAKVDVS
jgi:hypothetical protein